MTDPNKLESVEPIKSVEELEENTGSAGSDGQGQEDGQPSLTASMIGGAMVGNENASQDGTGAAPSETTENSEG